MHLNPTWRFFDALPGIVRSPSFHKAQSQHAQSAKVISPIPHSMFDRSIGHSVDNLYHSPTHSLTHSLQLHALTHSVTHSRTHIVRVHSFNPRGFNHSLSQLRNSVHTHCRHVLVILSMTVHKLVRYSRSRPVYRQSLSMDLSTCPAMTDFAWVD